MRIGGGGSQDVNQLQSDVAQYRNVDFAVAQGQGWMGQGFVQAAAAEHPHLQCLNPAASGEAVIVDAVAISSQNAGFIRLAQYDTALTTDFGDAVNLLLGGTAPSLQIRTESNATPLGTVMGGTYIGANNPWLITFRYPIIMGAGRGILINHSITQSIIGATFYGRYF